MIEGATLQEHLDIYQRHLQSMRDLVSQSPTDLWPIDWETMEYKLLSDIAWIKAELKNND